MKKQLRILLLVIGHLSFVIGDTAAQAVSPKTTAVMVDAAGRVVWPANFWPANATSLPSPTPPWSAITGKPTTLAGYGITDAVKTPAVMVCVIQLKTAPGDTWTDFEFKIMTQSGGVITLHLYYHSPDPGRTVVSGQVGTVSGVWFTSSSTSGDSRLLRKQSASQSIWQMLGGGSNTTTSVMIAVPVNGIIRPDNAALFIEYLRFSPTDHERDAAGRSIWRIVEPSWRTVMPTP